MAARRKAFRTVALVVVMVVLSGLAAGPAWGQQPERVKVFIAFGHQPGPAEETLVHRAGGIVRYTYHLVPAVAATLPEPAIQGLLKAPGVVRIEPIVEVYAVDAELDNAWGVKRIGAGLVHDGGNKGAGVSVAVIDSGIDYQHPDLDANYVGGYDFVNSDDDPMDDAGHGTHVAGTIAGEDDGAGVVGVAPSASLYALKVLGADGNGSYDDVIAALQWAVDHGIQVTNNSYGSSGDPGYTVEAAFDNAYAHGVLNVCSAGNSGNPPGRGDNVGYPGRYTSCIAVAATDQADKRARFSSTGPDVELAAPGVGIYSTVPGGGYESWSGTSMASPHVAGTAALVIASGLSDLSAVRQRLVETADDLGDTGLDPLYGYGLVDANGAVQQGDMPPTVSITNPVDGSTVSGTVSVTADASDSGGVMQVEFFVDGISIGVDTNGSDEWSASWNTALSGEGPHTVGATATDTIGQVASDSVGVTVSSGGSTLTMYAADIAMSFKTAGPNRSGIAVVTILDTAGNPVEGAAVSGIWSGDYSGSVTGVTGSDGTVRFESGKVRQASFTFTFAVDNVAKSGYAYDSTLGETSGTITVP